MGFPISTYQLGQLCDGMDQEDLDNSIVRFKGGHGPDRAGPESAPTSFDRAWALGFTNEMN